MRPSPNDLVPRSSIALAWVRLLLLSIAALPFLALPVAKAEYQTLEKKLENAKANMLRTRTVRRVLTDPAIFRDDAQLKVFDSYYTDFLFPLMTQTSPRGLGYVGKARESLFRDLENRKIHAAAHRHLTELTFGQMKQIATGDFHPVARYNAVLALGKLDQQPASGGDQPPVPYAEAADVLLDLIQPDAQNVPDAVQIGALIGLKRHVALGLSAERADRLQAAAIALLGADRPADRTPEGHAWLQTVAAQTLVALGRLGDDASVHKALLTLIGDSERPLSNRCREIKALAILKPLYTAEAGVDAESTAASIATLVKDVIEAESEEAEKFRDMTLNDRIQRSDLDEEIKFPRRRLLDRIECLLQGLDAVDAVLAEEAKPHLQEIRDGLTEIQKIAADKESIDLALSSETSGTIAPRIIAAAESLLPSDSDEGLDALEDIDTEGGP